MKNGNEMLQAIIRQSLVKSNNINFVTIFDMVFGLETMPSYNTLEMKKMLCEYHNSLYNHSHEEHEDNIYMGLEIISDKDLDEAGIDQYIERMGDLQFNEYLCGVGMDGVVYAFDNYVTNPNGFHGALINKSVTRSSSMKNGFRTYFKIVK